MEICYQCVFQQTINPSTRHPYVQNATISVQTYIPYKYYWKFEVHVSPAYHDGKPLLHKYKFIIVSGEHKKIEILLSDPTQTHVEVIYHLQSPTTSDAMSDYQVYSTVNFDSRYIFPEHIKSGFKIWMNIPHDIMGKECSEGFSLWSMKSLLSE